MAQKKETKKDVTVRDLAPKKDAKGGRRGAAAFGGGNAAQGGGASAQGGGASAQGGGASAQGNRGSGF